MNITYSVKCNSVWRDLPDEVWKVPHHLVKHWVLRGSLSTHVFEMQRVTGSELLSLLTCLHTTTFTLLSIFSPLETRGIKTWGAIMRAVTARTILVIVSPMFVPLRRSGNFSTLPSTTSPLTTNRSATQCCHDGKYYPNWCFVRDTEWLSALSDGELWDECNWSSGISVKNPSDSGEIDFVASRGWSWFFMVFFHFL